MSKYSLTKAEQETTIGWDAENTTAIIDTATPKVIRALDKLCEQYPDTYRCVYEDKHYYAKRYEVDSKYIAFRKPSSRARLEANRRNLPNISSHDGEAEAHEYADAVEDEIHGEI